MTCTHRSLCIMDSFPYEYLANAELFLELGHQMNAYLGECYLGC